MKFRSVIIFLFFLGLTIGLTTESIATPKNGEEAKPPQSAINHAQAEVKLPLKPEEFLKRIKQALEQGSFLHEDFYSDENLNLFFGGHYTFTLEKLDGDKNLKTIGISDFGNVYRDQDGQMNLLGKNPPILMHGKIEFFFDGNNAVMSFSARVRTRTNGGFYADLIKEIFGLPGIVTPGYPKSLRPLPHGYKLDLKSNKLGSSWLFYEVIDSSRNWKLQFRTLGDGEVIDMEITTRGK